MPLTQEQQSELDQLRGVFGGLSPDDFLEKQAIEATFEEKGMFDLIGEDLQKRNRQVGEAYKRQESGEQSYPEYMAQAALQGGAGAIADIGGRVVGEGLGYIQEADRLTGGYGAAALSQIGKLPTGTGSTIGAEVPKELGVLAEKYSQWAKDNPRAAANVEGVFNVGAVIAPIAKRGEAILSSGAGLVKTLSKKDINKLTAKELREMGGDLFAQADSQGGYLKPEFWNKYIDEITTKVKKETELGQRLKEATGGTENVEEAIVALKSVQGNPNSLNAIKEADSILGDLYYGTLDLKGNPTAAGKDFLMMQKTLRNMIDDAPEGAFIGGKDGFKTIKEARKVWAASNRMDDVERIISKAEGAQQPSTVIKNGFRRLRESKGFKFYSPEEQFAIRKAAKSGTIESFFKLTGSGLGTSLAGVGAGVATGNPLIGLGAAGAAFGARETSKGIAEGIARSKANKALGAIQASGTGAPPVYASPFAKQMVSQTALGMAPSASVDVILQESMSQRAKRLFDAKRNSKGVFK